MPCHGATAAALGPWDSQAWYPELAPASLGAGADGLATRLPWDTTVSDWAWWQLVLPKKDEEKRGQSCLHCHLRQTPLAEPPKLAGPRVEGEVPPEVAKLHRWFVVPEGWRRESVGVWVEVDTYQTLLVVTVKVQNYGVGHRVPSSLGPESLVLRVEAHDGQGRALRFVNGPTLPGWGAAREAGLPGHLYARVWGDLEGGATVDVSRAAGVLYDGRLHAGEHDELHYVFELPREAPPQGPAWETRAWLAWRPSWAEEGGEVVVEEDRASR